MIIFLLSSSNPFFPRLLVQSSQPTISRHASATPKQRHLQQRCQFLRLWAIRPAATARTATTRAVAATTRRSSAVPAAAACVPAAAIYVSTTTTTTNVSAPGPVIPTTTATAATATLSVSAVWGASGGYKCDGVPERGMRPSPVPGIRVLPQELQTRRVRFKSEA